MDQMQIPLGYGGFEPHENTFNLVAMVSLNHIKILLVAKVG